MSNQQAGRMGAGCFITGTDTDAGKTLVTAALLRALREQGLDACAVKPVQTGCTPHADGTFQAPDVALYHEAAGLLQTEEKASGKSQAAHHEVQAASPVKISSGIATDPLVHDTACKQGMPQRTVAQALYAFEPACSPHLALQIEAECGRTPPLVTVETLVQHSAELAQDYDWLLFEGAGGVFVPLNEQETMLDFMVALACPVVLVVRNGLGCINHALLSLHALRAQGLSVLGMVLTRTQPDPEDPLELRIMADNKTTLERLGAAFAAPVLAEIPYCVAFSTNDPAEREQAWAVCAKALAPVVEALMHVAQPVSVEDKVRHEALLVFDREHLWHPYTSMREPLPTYEAVSARGVRIRLADGREVIDGMSSWWCALHGYSHPVLVEALQKQAARMSHVMFGGFTHEPAVELGRRLLSMLPAGLEHLFYADSGSVAVEVALKMALQYWQSMGRPHKTRLLTVRGGYHGDTTGAMSVCDPVTGMHTLFTAMLAQQVFVARPSCRFDSPFDPACLQEMEQALEQHASELAAVIIEPVVQGAGGMWFYHPEYLRRLRALCEAHDVLLIADEIAVGFGRTGKLFGCDWAGITPDIMCVGKGLTGGMMTLAATAATNKVAAGISSGNAKQGGGVFMHGPTFMGNPLACAVACASLDLLKTSAWEEQVRRIEHDLREGLAPCRELDGVADVRVLGSIGVVETVEPVRRLDRCQAFFVEQGVWIRPFGRALYLMPPYTIRSEETARLTAALVQAVRERRYLD